MKKQNTMIVITALVCLTILETVALHKDIDGYLFSIIVMAISGIAGFKLPSIIGFFRRK